MNFMSFTLRKIECNLVKTIQKFQNTIEYHVKGVVQIKEYRIAPSKCNAQLLIMNYAMEGYLTTNIGINVAQIKFSTTADRFRSV